MYLHKSLKTPFVLHKFKKMSMKLIDGIEAKLGIKLRICYFLTCILSVLSARFQLENWSGQAQLGSARKLHSSGSLELENSNSNSSLQYIGYFLCKERKSMETILSQLHVVSCLTSCLAVSGLLASAAGTQTCYSSRDLNKQSGHWI